MKYLDFGDLEVQSQSLSYTDKAIIERYVTGIHLDYYRTKRFSVMLIFEE